MIALLRNEVLKLTTVPTALLLLGAQVALIVAGITGASLHGGIGLQGALAHAGFTSLFALILGMMAMAGEYRHRTIVSAYLGTPVRFRLYLSKLAVTSAAGFAFGLVGATVAAVMAAVWYDFIGDGFSWADPDLWGSLVGLVVANGLFAALGVALGAIVTNPTAAISVVLAWTAAVELILADFLGRAADWLPLAAGQALAGIPGRHGLSQVSGGFVLLGYVVALSIVALAVTQRRDVA